MKHISLILIITSIFLIGCDGNGLFVSDPVVTVETDASTPDDSWVWAFPLPGEIDTLFEGSICYTTNYMKAETTQYADYAEDGSWDNEGTIVSYWGLVDFFNIGGDPFGPGDFYSTSELAYGDTHVNVLYFPYNASLYDILAPTFNMQFKDIKVSYPHDGKGIINAGDTYKMNNLDCFYVYFQAITNSSYGTAKLDGARYSILEHFDETYSLNLNSDEKVAAREVASNPFTAELYKDYMKNLDRALRNDSVVSSRSVAGNSLPAELIEMADQHFGM